MLVMNNDRISDLHDSILWHILSLLPTKYAVRSSILSTRWKLLWTFVTKLDFVDSEGRYRDAEDLIWLQLFYPLGHFNSDLDEGRDKFTQFVNRLLLLPRNIPTPVHKFLLECNVFKCEQSQLNSWICQSIELAVKELIISIQYIDNPPISLPPPCRWIHCKTLVVLELIGEMCFINIPEFSSICFPSLQTLKLSLITYAVARNASVKFPKVKLLTLDGVLYESEDSLYKLFQSCPVLEHLLIRRSRWDNIPNMVISKPTLTSLVINITCSFEVPPGVGAYWRAKLDAPQLQCLTFIDSSRPKLCFSVETSALNSLTKATFDILFIKGQNIDTNYRNAVFKLVERLPSNLEHLLFVNSTMMVLLCSPPEFKLYNITVPMFRNLTTLDLHVCICFNWRAVMIMFKSLIEHMDNLQLLSLAHKEFCEKHESLGNDDQPLFEPRRLLPRLRQVKVDRIDGCTHEFELLRYILLNAKHLEVMTIVVSPWQMHRFQSLKTIFSMFPRGSPTCQIQVKLAPTRSACGLV